MAIFLTRILIIDNIQRTLAWHVFLDVRPKAKKAHLLPTADAARLGRIKKDTHYQKSLIHEEEVEDRHN